jgi:hypothetical protein
VKAYFDRNNGFVKCSEIDLPFNWWEGAYAIKKEIPIWEKSNLTLEEASAYFSIGINKLRELTNDKNCKYVIWCGNKRLIIRKRISKRMWTEM